MRYVKGADGIPEFTLNEESVTPEESEIAFLMAHPDATHFGSAFSALPRGLKNTNKSQGQFLWPVFVLNRDLVREIREHAQELAEKGIWASSDKKVQLRYVQGADGIPEFTLNGKPVTPEESEIAFLMAHPDVINFGNAFSALPRGLKNTQKSQGQFLWPVLNYVSREDFVLDSDDGRKGVTGAQPREDSLGEEVPSLMATLFQKGKGSSERDWVWLKNLPLRIVFWLAVPVQEVAHILVAKKLGLTVEWAIGSLWSSVNVKYGRAPPMTKVLVMLAGPLANLIVGAAGLAALQFLGYSPSSFSSLPNLHTFIVPFLYYFFASNLALAILDTILSLLLRRGDVWETLTGIHKTVRDNSGERKREFFGEGLSGKVILSLVGASIVFILMNPWAISGSGGWMSAVTFAVLLWMLHSGPFVSGMIPDTGLFLGKQGREASYYFTQGEPSSNGLTPEELVRRLGSLARVSGKGIENEVRKRLAGIGAGGQREFEINRETLYERLRKGRPIIDTKRYVVSEVTTPWGITDLTRLNDIRRYEGEFGGAELARDIEIAHWLGLLNVERMSQGMSAAIVYANLKGTLPASVKTIRVGWILWENLTQDAQELAEKGEWVSSDKKARLTYKRSEDGSPEFTVNGEAVTPEESEIAFLMVHPDATNFGSAFSALPRDLKNTKKSQGQFLWPVLNLNRDLVRDIRDHAQELAKEGEWVSSNNEVKLTYKRSEDGSPEFTVNGEAVTPEES
ncbi:MAG: M50 family metallopeptidase, partial [Elusimicrobia bacterium]|nr:M50 family metallopeptidase [Elusimicrobiota bacterium]